MAQNQGDQEGMINTFEAIGQHMFGNHQLCIDMHWCKYHENPLTYKHKGLPYGKPLSGLEIKVDVLNFLKKLSKKADRLTNLGSTQANESANHTIASMAPKDHHYSTSESLKWRVSAAVAQTNKVYHYTSNVCLA